MATEQSAAELKQQGAIEAAGNPDSSVDADDAQKKMVEESKNAGVAAFTFDPDASPEEKRRQAKAAVPDELRHHRKHKAVAVVTDADDGNKADYELPSPSRAGAIDVPKDKEGNPFTDDKNDEERPEDIAARVGWQQQFGWPHESPMTGESLLDHQTWLEGKIPATMYGDWYHNAGVIIFACLASWLVAVLGGGLSWVFIVMAICSTYYRTSIRRVRRNFRDDVTREMSLMKKTDMDVESLEWINAFMLKFWPIYQPVLAETIINSVDQVLSSATPAFLDSLKLKTFTLGSKPPRMEHVKTLPAEDDMVIMDWKFSFTPNDTADMTTKQIKNKVNPKVVLEIRVGKAMISKGLDVIVEDMAFSGIMRLKLKLQFPFPHVEKIEMCFMGRPEIDYVCKPLGGETFGFDINFIPGLESFILEQIHGNLQPMMYHPNVFPIEVAKMLAGTPVDQAIGVVAVTLHGAHGLKNPDNFAGTVDPYVIVSLSRRGELARTKTIKDTSNPRWNETKYVIISSFHDSLDLEIFDYNEIRKDKELGIASFQLDQLEELNVFENERLEVMSNGKARGVVSADVRFFPVLQETTLPDGKVEPPPETNTGILRFTLHQAKDLDASRSMVGLLNPYAALLLNGKEIHHTKKLKRTNNPIWDDGHKEILISDRKNAKLGIAIKDDRDLAGHQLVGTYQIKLEDLLEMMEQGKDWYNLSGVSSGRVKVTAQWKPVAVTGDLVGTGGYQTPIGVMRLHFKNARELRNFETMGKSDPYVRVVSSGIEKGRTVTHRNTLSPEFDEVVYVPMHSSRDRLTLEVMDAEKMGKDRSLGLVELLASDYIDQDENGEYLVHDRKPLLEDGLRLHGKGIAKGVLSYTASFYPCLNIADPEDEEEEEEEEEAAAAEESKGSLELTRSVDAGKISSLERKPTNGQGAPLSPGMPPITPTSPTFSDRKSRDAPRQAPKIRLTPEELLKHESGFLIFHFMEAEMPKSGSHVEVNVDDMLFPSYVSGSAKHKSYKFDEIGDCFIRELDFSRLTLKVREKKEKPGEERDEDHTIARLTGNTLDTLKQCLNNPTVLKFKDDENRGTWVKVSLKYIPVRMELDPSESINNMGNLRVDVLDAAGLPAADSNGKSDPYARFELNGQDIYKTKTQKKTLDPVWNEFFEVAVPSRTAANFHVNVYDYDFADKPDFLGGADINLEQLDPFKAKEMRLILDGKSGSIRIRLLFRPDYVTRTRMGTGTFAGTFGAPGKIMTGVAGAPLKGGAAVAGVVGHGVGKGASFLRRGFRGKKGDDDANGTLVSPGNADVPSIVTNGDASAPAPGLRRSTGPRLDGAESPETPPSSSHGASNGGHHHRTTSMGGVSVHSMAPGAAGAGTATFTIVSANGFPPSADAYVVVRQLAPKEKVVGKTKHEKSASSQIQYDETFKHTCSADTQFRLEVKGHHTFGSDDDLGETLYFVDDTQSGGEKEIKVGTGAVIIKSSFVENNRPTTSSDSPRSGNTMRRSFLSKKDTKPSRETTPS